MIIPANLERIIEKHGTLDIRLWDDEDVHLLRTNLTTLNGLHELFEAMKFLERSEASKKVGRTSEQMRDLANKRHHPELST